MKNLELKTKNRSTGFNEKSLVTHLQLEIIKWSWENFMSIFKNIYIRNIFHEKSILVNLLI